VDARGGDERRGATDAGMRAGVERMRPRGRRDELDHLEHVDHLDNVDGRADDARAHDHDPNELDNQHDLTGGLSCR